MSSSPTGGAILARLQWRPPAVALAGRMLMAGVLMLAGGLGAACDVTVADGGFSLGLASAKASDNWSRSYEIAEGGRFEVVNVNGIVRVEAAAGNTVEVSAERIAKASTDEDARGLLAKIEIAEEVAPDAVRIVTRSPKTWGPSGVEVRYLVKVPAGVHVKAVTTNGAIKLVGIGNQVEARTTNGGVEGDGLTGPVQASTTNGGIRLDFAKLSGDVEAGTTNGGVRIGIPRDARASIAASVTNGGISMGDLPVQTGERSRRRLEGTLNGGGPRVKLTTTNGGIRLSGR